jgi:hypothetical protein
MDYDDSKRGLHRSANAWVLRIRSCRSIPAIVGLPECAMDDRASFERPMPRTRPRKIGQRVAQGLQLAQPGVHVGEPAFGQRPDLGTIGRRIGIQPHQLAGFLQGEPECLAAADETQLLQIVVAVSALAGWAPRRRRQLALAFVVTDGIDRDASLAGEMPDAHWKALIPVGVG